VGRERDGRGRTRDRGLRTENGGVCVGLGVLAAPGGARRRGVPALLRRDRQPRSVVRPARSVGSEAGSRSRPRPGLARGLRRGEPDACGGRRRRTRPSPGSAGLRPGLPPLPRPGARPCSAARGAHRALHAHPVGGPGRVGGAPARHRRCDPRGAARVRQRRLPHGAVALRFRRLLRHIARSRCGRRARLACEPHRGGRGGVRCPRRRRRRPRAAGRARSRAPRDPRAPCRPRRPLEERGQGL